MNTLLATLLSGSGEVLDTTFSIALESGQLEHQDPDWDTVTSWSDPSVGVRVGYTINPNLEILGSVHYRVESSTSGNDYYYDYEESNETEIFSGYSIEVSETFIHIGPKVNWNIKPWLAPYGTAQGLIIHNQLRMGDEYSVAEEDSITSLSTSGIGVGLTGAVGLELRTRPIAQKGQLFFYGEGGGSVVSPLEFSIQSASADESDIDIGDLKYGGQYVRFGAGARF